MGKSKRTLKGTYDLQIPVKLVKCQCQSTIMLCMYNVTLIATTKNVYTKMYIQKCIYKKINILQKNSTEKLKWNSKNIQVTYRKVGKRKQKEKWNKQKNNTMLGILH